MKVALLNTNWYPQTGGGIVHVEELAERLVRNHGCEVDIITKSTDVSTEEWTDRLPQGASLLQIRGTDSSVRPLNELRYTIGVLRCVRSRGYDIVHAHTNTATFPLQLIRIVSDARTVVTIHGADLDMAVTFTGSALDRVYTIVRKLILKWFRYDAVISVSEELTEVLSKSHETVRFIPNGVDVESFPAPDGYGDKHILFVGRLRPKKNPTDLVEAMRTVETEHPDAVLHIVGEGPLREDVEEVMEQYEVSENVVFHGYVDDETLQELYKQCSVFVLPSDWEGHPLVLMEAWASGQVVVGTDVEGIREFIGEGYGETVPLNDPEALGETLSDLLSNPARVEERGNRVRSLVADEYSWESTVEETYGLYRELIGAKEMMQ